MPLAEPTVRPRRPSAPPHAAPSPRRNGRAAASGMGRSARRHANGETAASGCGRHPGTTTVSRALAYSAARSTERRPSRNPSRDPPPTAARPPPRRASAPGCPRRGGRGPPRSVPPASGCARPRPARAAPASPRPTGRMTRVAATVIMPAISTSISVLTSHRSRRTGAGSGGSSSSAGLGRDGEGGTIGILSAMTDAEGRAVLDIAIRPEHADQRLDKALSLARQAACRDRASPSSSPTAP